MATSYPRRDTASGLWRLSDITSNIKTEGTFPGTHGYRGMWLGGGTPSNSNVIDYVNITVAGNATDFGDLTLAKQASGALGSATRSILGAGLVSSTNYDVVEYVNPLSTGNAADFGDLTDARARVAANSNDTRGLFAGGRDSSGRIGRFAIGELFCGVSQSFYWLWFPPL